MVMHFIRTCEADLAGDCEGQVLSPAFRTELARIYGLPQAIMDSCLVTRGYIKPEEASIPDSCFSEIIPHEFRASA